MTQTRILFVDDDNAMLEHVEVLRNKGYDVKIEKSIDGALQLLRSENFHTAIIDTTLSSFPSDGIPPEDRHHNPNLGGVALARTIKRESPSTRVVAITADPNLRQHYDEIDVVFATKGRGLGQRLLCAIQGTNVLRTFIVHGHDTATKLELKNFLQNSLRLPEPIILHELPSYGSTIFEKLERESSAADAAFVLLTPDDKPASPNAGNNEKRRARQNVILELGYFLGRLGRGRVVLLRKGDVDLPSDISGIIYIDITNGITAAGELIRKEIQNM